MSKVYLTKETKKIKIISISLLINKNINNTKADKKN